LSAFRYSFLSTILRSIPLFLGNVNQLHSAWNIRREGAHKKIEVEWKSERLVRQWLNIGTMGREVSFDCQLFATLSYLLSISLLI
jgi:hypothetical protein